MRTVYGHASLAVLLLLAGCSGMKVEGECTYVREVKTTYACETGGKAEHIRVTPLE